MSRPSSLPDARAAAESRTAALVASDRRHLWHPFTQMRGWMESEEVIVVERAEGNWLVDTLGRRYLDGVSSLWVTTHGHRRAEIDAAVRAQLDRVAHSTMLGLASVPSIELAERLTAIAPPGLARVFYSDSGSTAVEIAVKIAYQYWQHRGRPEKRTFVAMTGAYHGDTLGSVAVGGIPLFHEKFKPLLGFEPLRFDAPYCYRCPVDAREGAPLGTRSFPSCETECLGGLERLLTERADEICAVIVEPLVQGAAGMIAQPSGWLARVRALCDLHGVLLIADEVAVGFGRTGAMFACEREGVAPDILCVAKGLTGGYLPLAATLATEEIFSAFLGEFGELKTFFHGHTYTGNPLACAAALANLEVFASERTVEGLAPKIARLEERLAPLAAHPHVGEIRQRGLMVGIELVADRAARAAYPFEARMGHRVCLECRADGVLLRPLGDVVVLMPPLSIAGDEIDLMVRSVSRSLDAVCGQ